MKSFTRFILFSVSIIIFISNLSDISAQETTNIKNMVTSEKKRLLILHTKYDDQDPYSIDKEVASTIANIATKLGRFEVIDRSNLKSILDEQTLHLTGIINDSMIVSIGNIAAAKEALLITVHNFSQKGVPKEDKEDEDRSFLEQVTISIIKGIFKKEKEDDPYANNIQTQLSVQVRYIEIETGKSLSSFEIDVGYTGGTRGKSRAVVMKMLKRQTIKELKTLYCLTSEVISVDNREVLLLLGEDIGVRNGTIFEIVEPDYVKTFGSRDVTLPGRRVGFVSVKDVSFEANRSVILRQWLPIKNGYKALEHTKTTQGLQVNLLTSPDRYYSLGIQAHVNPFHQRDWGFELRFIQIIDSFNDKDNGFGIGLFATQQFLNASKLTLRARLGLDFDVPFRKDDKNHTVNAAVLSSSVGISGEILLTENYDIIINAGYKSWGKSSKWTYSRGEGEDQETYPAVWNNDSPEVNISGFFLTIGFRIIFFHNIPVIGQNFNYKPFIQ